MKFDEIYPFIIKFNFIFIKIFFIVIYYTEYV